MGQQASGRENQERQVQFLRCNFTALRCKKSQTIEKGNRIIPLLVVEHDVMPFPLRNLCCNSPSLYALPSLHSIIMIVLRHDHSLTGRKESELSVFELQEREMMIIFLRKSVRIECHAREGGE